MTKKTKCDKKICHQKLKTWEKKFFFWQNFHFLQWWQIFKFHYFCHFWFFCKKFFVTAKRWSKLSLRKFFAHLNQKWQKNQENTQKSHFLSFFAQNCQFFAFIFFVIFGFFLSKIFTLTKKTKINSEKKFWDTKPKNDKNFDFNTKNDQI